MSLYNIRIKSYCLLSLVYRLCDNVFCTFLCGYSLTINADESRGSKAFIRVCLSVCLCLRVSLCDRTNTAETTITRLATGIVHHEYWLVVIGLILCRKVKGQSRMVTKCKKYFS